MKLVDKLMVYKGQFGYSTLLKNGEDKLYVQVGFRKGQEPFQEKAMIDIKDGFLSFYKDKNGAAKPKIVVLDYTELDIQVEQNYYDAPIPTNERYYDAPIPTNEPVFNPYDDDLPF